MKNDLNGVGDCIDFELCGNYQWNRARCGGQELPHGFIAEKGKIILNRKLIDENHATYVGNW